jgi:hypothetical protein
MLIKPNTGVAVIKPFIIETDSETNKLECLALESFFKPEPIIPIKALAYFPWGRSKISWSV